MKSAGTEGGAPSLLQREGFPEELTLQQQSSTFKMPLKLCLSVLSPSSEPTSSQVPASTLTHQPNCRPHPRSRVTSMLKALPWLSSLREQRTETCHHAWGPHMPRPAIQPHLRPLPLNHAKLSTLREHLGACRSLDPKTVLLVPCMARSFSFPLLPSYSPPRHGLCHFTEYRLHLCCYYTSLRACHPSPHKTTCASCLTAAILHQPGTVVNKHELNK